MIAIIAWYIFEWPGLVGGEFEGSWAVSDLEPDIRCGAMMVVHIRCK
jgi:hypothetical protein